MDNENNNLLISSINYNNTSINNVYDINTYYNVELSGTPQPIVWYDNDTHNTYYNPYYNTYNPYNPYNPYYNSGTQLNIIPSEMWYKDTDYQTLQQTTQEKLDSIDIKEIEKYLRQKKLDNINKK